MSIDRKDWPAAPPDPVAKALDRLADAIEGARLRHEINQILPPHLKPFGDLLGLIVDPTGAAAEMTRKYLEKHPPPPQKKKKKPVTRAQRRNAGKVRVKIPSDYESAEYDRARKKKRKRP